MSANGIAHRRKATTSRAMRRERWVSALRRRCALLYLNQTAIAAATGVRVASAQRWWWGESSPTDDHLPALAALLGLSVAETRDLGGGA